MPAKGQARHLRLHRVEQKASTEGEEELVLHTDAGLIPCRFHPTAGGDVAVLWVFGAGGGLGGPAGGMYARLASQLTADQAASLRLDYRQPGELEPCVLDVLLGIAYLGTRGRTRVLLVGHSFGGAVVISAGISPAVVGVAALSSQTYGTQGVSALSPRPLLLMHGTADEVLPAACSRNIYARAREPKQLLFYPGCRHGLDQCREEIDRDLLRWLREVASKQAETDLPTDRGMFSVEGGVS